MLNFIFGLICETPCGRPQLWNGVYPFSLACLSLRLVFVVLVCLFHEIRWVLLAV
jgi:hypothetical protein